MQREQITKKDILIKQMHDWRVFNVN